jgi:hypothetical protein
MSDAAAVAMTRERPRALRVDAVSGVPWVVGIFVGATVSYILLRLIFTTVNVGPYPLMSIGTMLIGAAIATAFALAGYWPLHNVANARVRATALLLISLVLAFAWWTIFSGLLKFNMVAFAFPIIATFWWFIAATSFVGEEAHVANLPASRRTLLNLIIWVGGTWLVLRTIAWIPPFWFGLVQTLLVTGGFAYLLRGVKQPAKSVYSWAVLAFLTAIAIALSLAFGIWDSKASLGPWAIGGPTAGWGIFFGLWCGLNYGVLALIQCWPFSLIRQPWGSAIAVVTVTAWCAVLAWVAATVFSLFYSDRATALLEAQVWAWHTVFWGFCFALLFGIGSAPYLWAGQKTPGSWEDVDAPAEATPVAAER